MHTHKCTNKDKHVFMFFPFFIFFDRSLEILIKKGGIVCIKHEH
jgi:hypothetical protein